MIGIVIKLVPRVLRSLRTLPLPTPPPPKRGRNQLQVQGPRALCLLVVRPLRRAAVVYRAGVLALLLHPTTLAGKVRMSLLAATRVVTQTATGIVVSANLLPTTLPMAVGAAEALVALAVVRLAVPAALAVALLVVLVALGEAPTVGVATCPGIKSGRRLLLRKW